MKRSHVLLDRAEDIELFASSVRQNIYDTLERALARFRFAPDQDCANPFIADWIARSSLREFRRADGSIGWTWRSIRHSPMRPARYADMRISGHGNVQPSMIPQVGLTAAL